MLGIERGSSMSYYIELALEEATDLLARQTTECCEGHSGKIWTHLVCSNCINFRLYIKLLAQHWMASWKHSLWGVATLLVDSRLRSLHATAEARYPTEHTAACPCFTSTDDEYLTV